MAGKKRSGHTRRQVLATMACNEVVCNHCSQQLMLAVGLGIFRSLLATTLTLYLLLELISLDVLFDEAWPVTKLGFPLSSPLCADTVLAFNLALELVPL